MFYCFQSLSARSCFVFSAKKQLKLGGLLLWCGVLFSELAAVVNYPTQFSELFIPDISL